MIRAEVGAIVAVLEEVSQPYLQAELQRLARQANGCGLTATDRVAGVQYQPDISQCRLWSHGR